ncbi:MAG: four helix bundle protein [Candidatus Omnitrophica bacterium]|nr:four helix bundle protein [Candidatus Omnitrophota bacterium]
MKRVAKRGKYDLEERTLVFAANVRGLVKKLPRNLTNFEDCKQLTRASGSIGANYIEANEALGKKDFLMKLRICRKEAKESKYWLNLIDTREDQALTELKDNLLQESHELMCIFGSILHKCN